MFDRLFKRRTSGLETARTINPEQAIRVTLDELINLRLQARQLSLNSKQPATHLMSGNHVSHFKGRGMDYMESRIYQAGDDIRNMDWRVTARTGQPHIKLFQEERQRPVMIMLDYNPGMFFASQGRFKSVVASQAAALLAWSAMNNGDRIGGLIINHGHTEIADKPGKKGILALLNAIQKHSDPHVYLHPQAGSQQANNEQHFSDGLERLIRMSRPGSLVFVFSDFYQLDKRSTKKLSQLKQHADCVLIRLTDPLETTPPPANRYAVTNGEQQTVINTSNHQQSEHYLHWFTSHQTQVRQLANQMAMPLIDLSTTQPPLEILRKYFASNSRGKKLR
jgi:uncharacterized protein (DUF58 family)